MWMRRQPMPQATDSTTAKQQFGSRTKCRRGLFTKKSSILTPRLISVSFDIMHFTFSFWSSSVEWFDWVMDALQDRFWKRKYWPIIYFIFLCIFYIFLAEIIKKW